MIDMLVVCEDRTGQPFVATFARLDGQFLDASTSSSRSAAAASWL